MASWQLIHTINFNADVGDFSSGDQVKIYFDIDTDLSIVVFSLPFYTADILPAAWLKVELNGVQITRGSYGNSVIPIKNLFITRSDTGLRYCNSNNLAYFQRQTTFPYIVVQTVKDSLECIVNSPVCDLSQSGVVTVTGTSDADVADGIISFSATSSNGPIQWRLNSDFSYGLQTANEFNSGDTVTINSLIAGSYRVYLRDSKNCGVNFIVDVPVDLDYDPVYRLQYYDRLGYGTYVEIGQRTFVGDVTDTICGNEEPFVLEMHSVEDRFTSIMSTSGVINLISEVNEQWIDLFTENPRKWKLTYKKDLGSGYTTMWEGFILPFQYSESYQDPPYIVSFKATDGLAELDKFVLSDQAGLKLRGRVKAIRLIAYCLKQTGLRLPIRVAINMYATATYLNLFFPNGGPGMATTSASDPLDQSYVDLESYYISDSNPSLSSVIRKILSAFGARIIQFNGAWNIIRIEEMIASFDYRQFDYDGVYVSNSTNSTNIKSLSKFVDRTQTLDILKGYGKIRQHYIFGKRDNLLYNGDFKIESKFDSPTNTYIPDVILEGFSIVKTDYPVGFGYELIKDNDVAIILTSPNSLITGDAYIISDTFLLKAGSQDSIKFKYRVKVPDFWNGLSYTTVPYAKLRTKVQYGTYYLQGNGTWETTDSEVVFYIKEFNKYVDYELTTIELPPGTNSGLNMTVILYQVYIFHADHSSTTTLKAVTTTTLPVGTKTQYKETILGSLIRLNYYELENNTSAESIPDIVRPNDYNATTNPYQWILKAHIFNQGIDGAVQKTFIDKEEVTQRYGNEDSADEVINDVKGQSNNFEVYEYDIHHGSFFNNYKLSSGLGFSSGILGIPGGGSPSFAFSVVSSLSTNLMYTSWLSDSDGDGYTTWRRDGNTESLKLEEIDLAVKTKQLNRSVRRLTGTIRPTEFVMFINCFLNSVDSKYYLPTMMKLSDKKLSYDIEVIEIVTENIRAFSSGFSNGFS